MQDDFTSLFAFKRWANAKMLDACRKLTPEQRAAPWRNAPGPGSLHSPAGSRTRTSGGAARRSPSAASRVAMCGDFRCASSAARLCQRS